MPAEDSVGAATRPPPSTAVIDSPGPGDASVALLFLTIKDPKNPDVWESWLRDVPSSKYDIVVHAKEKGEVAHPLFKPCTMKKPVKTKWGTVSLVKAHIALMRKALENTNNQWFVLLSDSCLSIVSFETFYTDLSVGFSWFVR
ncbi:core-2/I-branching enzyme-domain-containing protein [Baffinella frigidus]|nr:core-2/I-branching enzyme-domain-containing protein [Cryptophyta sp. CCMP2293]